MKIPRPSVHLYQHVVIPVMAFLTGVLLERVLGNAIYLIPLFFFIANIGYYLWDFEFVVARFNRKAALNGIMMFGTWRPIILADVLAMIALAGNMKERTHPGLFWDIVNLQGPVWLYPVLAALVIIWIVAIIGVARETLKDIDRDLLVVKSKKRSAGRLSIDEED